MNPMLNTLRRCWFWVTTLVQPKPRAIPDALWHSVLSRYDFLHALPAADQAHLGTLSALFLQQKQFSGAQGFVITDEVALCVAAQACLPLLHIAPRHQPHVALAWYNSFVGIVVHASEVVARRSSMDDAGVVHHWHESLTGEAMQGGPLMLSWSDVLPMQNIVDGFQHATDARRALHGRPQAAYNVVIHEFAHVIDMHGGAEANGCPPLDATSVRDASDLRDAQRIWKRTLHEEYEQFCEACARAERFGGDAPLLDPYGAESIAEFFSVAVEAYCVQRGAFASTHPRLLNLFDGFFRPAQLMAKSI